MTPTGSSGPAGDVGDFQVIQDFARHTGWLHGFMADFAVYGVVLFALFLLAGWWLARRNRNLPGVAASVWALIGALIAVALNQVISHTVAEARPYNALPHVLVLVGRAADYGFTSDHSTMAGAVATGLLYVNRRLGVAAWCAAILLAFSRVYVGAHYPHDVVAGLGLGTAVVVIGRIVAQPLLAWLATRLSTTPLRPLVAPGAAASRVTVDGPVDSARTS